MPHLFISRQGFPMKKEQVTQYYKDLAALVGEPNEDISGHSARVTGAMRMAIAGHSEWVIQVFGRWSGETVLKYVRSALLGMRGGNIAQKTEECAEDLRTVRRQVRIRTRERVASVGDTSGHARGIVEWALERAADQTLLRNGSQVQQACLRDAVQHVTRLLSSIEYNAEDVHTGIPNFVQCIGGLKHVVLDHEKCGCGWSWKAASAIPITDGPSSDCAGWCTRCLDRVGTLGLGV